MGARVAALVDILDTMADKVRTAVNGIDWDIQVEPWLVINPTPLTVDMFPAEPPTDDTLTGFGDLEVGRIFTVRARTNTPDVDGARDAILALMDIEDAHSVVVALTDDQTLAGLATQVVVQGGTGLSVFPTPDGLGGYLGVQWTVIVIDIPDATPTPSEEESNMIVRGPFPFAFDTPGIEDGIAFYTPTVGEILFDVWWDITTPFDGTSPHADVGTFVDVTNGLWGIAAITVPDGFDLSVAGNEGGGTGLFLLSNVFAGSAAGLGEMFSLAGDQGLSTLPGRFTATNPLKIVVSQEGEIGGTPVGGTAGEGNIYIVTAIPVAL